MCYDHIIIVSILFQDESVLLITLPIKCVPRTTTKLRRSCSCFLYCSRLLECFFLWGFVKYSVFCTLLICEGVPTTNANLFLSGFQTYSWAIIYVCPLNFNSSILLLYDVLISVCSNLISHITFYAHKNMFSSVHITY